jgi:HTH-type transcriptional regulator, glycine betaine synthesis regulator
VSKHATRRHTDESVTEARERQGAPRGRVADGLIRPGGRSEQVLLFEREVVGFFVDAAEVLGIPKSVAAIYAICFASVEPLGFTEINDRLEISSGSISQGLRALREVGALKVVVTPIDYRERFEPDLQLRNLMARFIEQRLSRQLDSGYIKIKSLMRRLPPPVAGGQLLRHRIVALQEWHRKTRAIVPFIKSFMALR